MNNRNLLFFDNLMANLPRAIQGHDLEVFANQFPGVPALICSAGPSLNRNLHELELITRAVQGRCLIVCVDAAMRVMYQADWNPHIIVTCDPLSVTSDYLSDIVESYLLWEISANSTIPNKQSISTVINSQCLSQIYKTSGRGGLDAWGSVSSLALAAVHKMGCRPVYFIGQDFSYRDHTHAAGSLADRPINPSAPYQCVDFGANQQQCISTYVLRSYRDYLSNQAIRCYKPGEVINLTGEGIFTGVQQMTMAEFRNRVYGMQSLGLWRRLENLYCQEPATVDIPAMVEAIESLDIRSIVKYVANSGHQGAQEVAADHVTGKFKWLLEELRNVQN